MASLNRPESKPDVRRQDFLDWSDKYILPNGDFSCSSLDLYAARCALVHTYTPISKLSRQKKAKEILYAWGKADGKGAQAFLDEVGMTTNVVVHIDDLTVAFRAGVEQFVRDMASYARKGALARRRAPQLRNARERGLEIEFDVAIHEDDCKANVVYSLLIDQEFIKVLAEVEANLAISLYKPS
ncbi:MAG: hypothetical protein IID38_12465 [Planctomycetes bacterium]|nr:hypothetical protein [Planctomycetota bacterium]